MEIGNFEFIVRTDLMLKIGRRTRNSCPPTPTGCPFGGNQLSGGVPKLYSFLFKFRRPLCKGSMGRHRKIFRFSLKPHTLC